MRMNSEERSLGWAGMHCLSVGLLRKKAGGEPGSGPSVGSDAAGGAAGNHRALGQRCQGMTSLHWVCTISERPELCTLDEVPGMLGNGESRGSEKGALGKGGGWRDE